MIGTGGMLGQNDYGFEGYKGMDKFKKSINSIVYQKFEKKWHYNNNHTLVA